MQRAIICASALALSGCASDAIRPVASGTMRLSQGLQSELTAFAARQNAELEARRSEIATLDENSRVSAFAASEQLMDWRADGKDGTIRLYEQATGLPIGTQLAGTATSALLAPPGPDGSVNLDAKNYDALVKSLKPLADKRSALKDLSFLVSYGQAVVNSMESDVAKASEPDTGADKPATVEKGNE